MLILTNSLLGRGGHRFIACCYPAPPEASPTNRGIIDQHYRQNYDANFPLAVADCPPRALPFTPIFALSTSFKQIKGNRCKERSLRQDSAHANFPNFRMNEDDHTVDTNLPQAA